MNRYHLLLCFLPALLVGCGTPAHEKEAAKALAAKEAAEAGRTREFLFTYEATVTGLRQGQLARVWVPLPPNGEDQQVTMPERNWPGDTDIKKENVDGNVILYLEARADRQGQISVLTTYHVVRREVAADTSPAATRPSERADSFAAEEYPQFLKADPNVPDAKVQALLAGKKLPLDPMKAVRVLYDTALRSGSSDNAELVNLFIALVRSQGIPAKLEIGFLLPEGRAAGTIAGYHCWAEVLPAGRGWIPIDISQAKAHPDKKDYYFGHLDRNRLALSTGRDVNLVPRQAGPPVELLIYPQAEVDGQPYPERMIKHTFTYRGVTPPATLPAKSAKKR